MKIRLITVWRLSSLLCADASLNRPFRYSHRDSYCTDRCHCDPDVTSLINEYTMALNGNPLVFKLWKETKHEFCPLINTGIPCLNNISTNKITLKIIEVILNHLKRYNLPQKERTDFQSLNIYTKISIYIYTQISRQTWLWYCFRILMTYSCVIIYLYIQRTFILQP